MKNRTVGVELDGIIECMNCIIEKEEDDFLDRAVDEGRFISVGEAKDKNLTCSVCGQSLVKGGEID